MWNAANAAQPYPRLSRWVEDYGRSVPSHPCMAEIMMIGSSWVQKIIAGVAFAESAAAGMEQEVKEHLSGMETDE